MTTHYGHVSAPGILTTSGIHSFVEPLPFRRDTIEVDGRIIDYREPISPAGTQAPGVAGGRTDEPVVPAGDGSPHITPQPKESIVTTASKSKPAPEPASPLLASITHGIGSAPKRIMIYGVGGIGKSTFAACAPSPIFIRTEDRQDHIDAAKFPLCKTLDDVFAQIWELHKHPHEFKTLVLDSADWLQPLIWAQVCSDEKVAKIDDIGYAKGYSYALTYWRQVLAGLDALRTERGMEIIIVAHSAIEKYSDPTSESYDRYTPNLHKAANAMLQEWCDNILFATTKVLTRSADAGFNKKEVKAIASAERVIKTTPSPAYIAKNSHNLPEELPLAYAEFAKARTAA